MGDDAYTRLREWCDDLAARRRALAAWEARNPGWRDLDEDDWSDLYARDPKPFTNDVVSVERFHDLMVVALAAFERSHRG